MNSSALRPRPSARPRPSGLAQDSEKVVGLLDPRFEHDSCGVGFVATVDGRLEHSTLQHAMTALARLAHRGAVAADGASSDGGGTITWGPR